MVRVKVVEDNYVSSFNFFRLCKVEKLRQTILNLLSRIDALASLLASGAFWFLIQTFISAIMHQLIIPMSVTHSSYIKSRNIFCSIKYSQVTCFVFSC